MNNNTPTTNIINKNYIQFVKRGIKQSNTWQL